LSIAFPSPDEPHEQLEQGVHDPPVTLRLLSDGLAEGSSHPSARTVRSPSTRAANRPLGVAVLRGDQAVRLGRSAPTLLRGASRISVSGSVSSVSALVSVHAFAFPPTTPRARPENALGLS
jgi:hypothetical protein